MTWRVVEGDCLERLADLEEASVDAIVTDPPYGLGFMGKAWDELPPGKEWGGACLRVLKPGGHLLAFGGSRTYHRLACAVEDAGFEVRDQLMWIYGSGFPKSLDVSKAIDDFNGCERKRVIQQAGTSGSLSGPRMNVVDAGDPVSPEAETWNGWGTALKPAHEPIVVARKPLSGTVAENVLAHGTGGLNIDGCRIDGRPPSVPQPIYGVKSDGVTQFGAGEGRNGQMSEATGRWPANVVFDEEAGRLLDERNGEQFSRFFYCAKASKGERNAGLEGFEEKPAGVKNDSGRGFSEGDPYREIRRANFHPTVKPIELMRYLCRLVTPPGGLILDPFLGSGTTGCAAVLEGFDFVGIEREPDYVAIAEARIKHWAAQPVQLGLLGEAA